MIERLIRAGRYELQNKLLKVAQKERNRKGLDMFDYVFQCMKLDPDLLRKLLTRARSGRSDLRLLNEQDKEMLKKNEREPTPLAVMKVPGLPGYSVVALAYLPRRTLVCAYLGTPKVYTYGATLPKTDALMRALETRDESHLGI